MGMRASYLAAACSLAFAPVAYATIVGSTYDFTASAAGGAQISPSGGPTLETDPANPVFCVEPPMGCSVGSGAGDFYNALGGTEPVVFDVNTADPPTIREPASLALLGGALLGSV
jgi:hypothetical protein